MLIDFRVKNFRSIKEEQIFSLEADGGCSELPEVLREPAGLAAGMKLLPTAAIFGPNASGKTTLVKAMSVMNRMVMRSFADSDDERSPIHLLVPFLLDEGSAAKPVEMEMTFLSDGVRYRYAFGVKDQKVVREALHAWPKGKEALVFERVATKGSREPGFKVGSTIEGGEERARSVSQQTHPQSLFVSTGQKLNHPAVAPVFSWFQESFRPLDHTRPFHPHYSADQFIKEEGARTFTNALMRWADLGIAEMRVVKESVELGDDPDLLALPESVKRRIFPEHSITGLHGTSCGDAVALDLNKDESHGTQRIFGLAGPLRDVLQNGRTLVVDELSTGFHHWMVRQLVTLFQNPETNPHGAQLIFTSHDPLLLDLTLMRRDQLVFVTKNSAGASEFYALADVEGAPRKDAVQLHKQYLSGAFDAIPHLGDLRDLTRALGSE